MGDGLKDPEINQRRKPKDQVKNQRAKEFRQNHLPVTHRRGHERLDRAELKLLREEAHRNERKNQDKSEPEEDRIEKRLLDGILHGALVHERNLEIKIDPGHEQEKNENDVSDRRIKIAAHFAPKQGVELTHRVRRDGVME